MNTSSVPAATHLDDLLGGSARLLRLVLLSGEQILPNLESVLLAMTSDRLAWVHIACIHKATRSQQPAQKLAVPLDSLDASNWNVTRRPATTLSEPIEGSSQAVRARI